MCACSVAIAALLFADLALPGSFGGPAAQPEVGQSLREDWPRFLGPRGDGRSRERGLLTEWPDSGPEVLWHIGLGEGYSMPSVVAGRIYVFDRHGDTVRLAALRAEDASEIWRSEYESHYEDQFGYSNGPRASPVVDAEAGKVYAFGVRWTAAMSRHLRWPGDLGARHRGEVRRGTELLWCRELAVDRRGPGAAGSGRFTAWELGQPHGAGRAQRQWHRRLRQGNRRRALASGRRACELRVTHRRRAGRQAPRGLVGARRAGAARPGDRHGQRRGLPFGRARPTASMRRRQ